MCGHAAPQSLPFVTRLLPHLLYLGSTPPHYILFTISPSWLAKIGTVANALSPTTSVVSKPSILGRIEERESASGVGKFRPASLFGSLFGGAPSTVAAKIEERADDEGEGPGEDDTQGTIKARQLNSDAEEGSQVTSSSRLASTTARLSTLFSDWGEPASPFEGKTKIVSDPVPIPRLAGGGNSVQVGAPLALDDSLSEALDRDELEGEEELDESLESLMVGRRFSFPMPPFRY